MTTESLEELRERLLRQQNVQQMIQVRAYEIYKMRGGKPGGEAQDWFQAQGEVLAFLIANESAREDQAELESLGLAPASDIQTQAPTAKKPRRSAGKPAVTNPATAKKAASKPAAASKSPKPSAKSKKTNKQSKPEKSAG